MASKSIYEYFHCPSCQENKPHRVRVIASQRRLYRFAKESEAKAKVKALNANPRPDEL